MLVVRRRLSLWCHHDVIRAAVLQLFDQSKAQQIFGQSKTQGECGLPVRKQAL